MDIKGVDAIANSLKISTTLIDLNLCILLKHVDNNYIKDEGAKLIAQGLENNKTLKIFNLGSN